ncbi:MAG: zinc ribbon domain-containing protein [Chromatiales bacterium]|nr:MAG: zinc ribbon domain-containing protein [Chromatiales bacterium]
MPIYGYVCKSCEHRFDVLQKMSDDPLVHCPDCGDASLQKELSAPKFRLKGQGWYETDFKTGSKRNLHGESGSGKTADAAKTPDSKPAAKKTSGSKADAS